MCGVRAPGRRWRSARCWGSDGPLPRSEEGAAAALMHPGRRAGIGALVAWTSAEGRGAPARGGRTTRGSVRPQHRPSRSEVPLFDQLAAPSTRCRGTTVGGSSLESARVVFPSSPSGTAVRACWRSRCARAAELAGVGHGERRTGGRRQGPSQRRLAATQAAGLFQGVRRCQDARPWVSHGSAGVGSLPARARRTVSRAANSSGLGLPLTMEIRGGSTETPSSQRHVPVLAMGQCRPLGAEHLQGSDQD
jgi:hypothetical protein